MANALSDALSNLVFNAGDTSWGTAASTLAGVAPKLINPYGSVGQNLSVGLGSVLLTALLQHQGKRSALESSLETTSLANQLMEQADTPEERLAYLKSLNEQGVDTDVASKISTLASALNQADKEQALASAARKDAALQELYGKIAFEKGIPLESARDWLLQREKLLSEAAVEATGKPAGLPSQYQTPEEVKAEQARMQDINSRIEKQRTEVQSSPDYKTFAEARNALETAKRLPTRDTEASVQAMQLLFNKILNPGNQVTLAEADRTGQAELKLNRFRKIWDNATTMDEKKIAIATMGPQAMNELLDISELVVDSLGKQYNSRVIGSVGALRAGPLPVPEEYANVRTISPTGKLYLSRTESNKKKMEISQLTSKINQIVARQDLSPQTKSMAVSKAKEQLQALQRELEDFEKPVIRTDE